MISEKLQNAINEQITAEMWSSNLYLAMSFYMDKERLLRYGFLVEKAGARRARNMLANWHRTSSSAAVRLN